MDGQDTEYPLDVICSEVDLPGLHEGYREQETAQYEEEVDSAIQFEKRDSRAPRQRSERTLRTVPEDCPVHEALIFRMVSEVRP